MNVVLITIACWILFGAINAYASVKEDFVKAVNLESITKKGLTASKVGQTLKVSLELKNFISKHKGHPLTKDALLLIGKMHFNQKQYEQAAISLAEYNSIYPNDNTFQENTLLIAKAATYFAPKNQACDILSQSLEFMINPTKSFMDAIHDMEIDTKCKTGTRKGFDFSYYNSKSYLIKEIKKVYLKHNLETEIKIIADNEEKLENKKLQEIEDKALCKKIVPRSGSYIFPEVIMQKYVREGFRRNLHCTRMNGTRALISIASDKQICVNIDLGNEVAKERNARGLNCGVEDDEAEKKRITEEKALQARIKAEQERIKKKEEASKKKIAVAKARQKKIAEEKARQKKKAEEEARQKRLAEKKQKQELAQVKLNKQIANYKRKAANFYKDIENYVKSGGNVDLVKLSDFFDVKPNPKDNWYQSDLSRYEKLREFMKSIPQFVSYEKKRIGERLKNSFALKDKSVAELKQNLIELKTLMRKMFGSSEVAKIKDMIKDIKSTLSDFNQLQANKLIIQTTDYISNTINKFKVVENKKASSNNKLSKINISWDKVKNDFSIKQRQFCKLTDDFYIDLNDARKSKNDIRINKVHKQRQQNLDGLIPDGKIEDWIFKVIKIQQIENGSAGVILKLQCKSFVGSGQIHTKSTWRSKINKEWRATIPYNDRRFRELEKLSAGEFVLGSGTLLEVDAFKPGQKETFYASQQIGEHPLTKGLNLEGELFIADLSYIAALN